MFFLSNRDNKTEVFDKKFEFFRVSVENRHLRFGRKNKTRKKVTKELLARDWLGRKRCLINTYQDYQDKT